MKFKKNILLLAGLLLSSMSFAQTQVTKESTMGTVNEKMQDNIFRKITPLGLRQSFGAVVNLAAQADSVAKARVPQITSTQLRAGSTAYDAVILSDKQGATFRFNPSNTTAADDSAMVIRMGSRRYERVFYGPVNPDMFGAVGNGITDDTQAWQKCINYVSSLNYARKIFAPDRYLISATLHHNNNQVRGIGLIIEGSNREKSGFFTYNITGPLFQIDGNDDNTPQNTTYRNAYGMSLSNFFIRRSPASTTGTVSGIEFSSQKDFFLHDLYIYGMGADGIKLTSIGFTDFGESSNGKMERVWVEGCPGVGFNLKGSPTSTFTAGYITFDHISSFYNGTGVYLEMCDQVTIHDSQIVGNTNYGIHVGRQDRGTARHIFIFRNELGNSNLLSSIRIESVVRAHIYENRFVLNPTETTAKQVELGTSDGAGVAQKVLIESNYIIQSRADTPGHYQYFIHPSNGDFHDITIRDDYYIEFQSGSKYNDISRINVLRERTGNGTPVQDRRGVKGIVFPTTNATSATPNPVYNYRHQFTASATLTINNPIGPAQEGQKFSYAIQSGSASQIVVSVNLGNEYIVTGEMTFILPPYKGDFLSFEYVAGYWRVLGAKTLAGGLITQTANATSTTPDPLFNHRHSFSTSASLVINNPSSAGREGQVFNYGLINTSASEITVSVLLGSDYLRTEEFIIRLPAFQGHILEFKFFDGYWWVLGSKTPTPLTEVALTNPTSVTPKKGEIHLLLFTANTTTTINNPTGNWKAGDELPIAVWNNSNSTVTATWGSNFRGNITVPTGVTDAKFLVFRYVTGYWIQVK